MLEASTNDRHAESDRRLGGLGRWGTVVEVDGRRCHVQISENFVTGPIPWLAYAAGAFRAWRAPTLGEQGLVLFPEADVSQGLFLPGVYSDAFPEPPAGADQLVFEMQAETVDKAGLRIVMGRQGDQPVAVIRSMGLGDENADAQPAIVLRDDHLSLLAGGRFFNITPLATFASPITELPGAGPFTVSDAAALAL